MNDKSITFVTNLPIWSMADGVGAPSMYLTLMGYADSSCHVNYFTTESNVDNHHYKFTRLVSIEKLDLMKVKRPILRKLLKYFNWFFLNLVMLILLLCYRPKGIIYAYEVFFVPATKLYSLIVPNVTLVTRFQGTILTPLLQTTKIQKLKYYVRKFDHIAALQIKSNLIIMTDDGTQGDQVLNLFKNNSKLLFIKNGVGWSDTINKRTRMLNVSSDIIKLPTLKSGVSYFYTACRLNSWKRVDRAIDLFMLINGAHPDSHLFIVGSGPEMEYLKAIVARNGADSRITFLGPLPQRLISQLAREMDFFISANELSNVGNPLWEAIEAGASIITIANGETNKYIKNLQNGFIQPEGDFMLNSKNVLRFLRGELDLIEKPSLPSDLTSWDLRIKTELDLVLSL